MRLSVSVVLLLTLCIVPPLAWADQYNDNYFLSPEELPQDLSGEAPDDSDDFYDVSGGSSSDAGSSTSGSNPSPSSSNASPEVSSEDGSGEDDSSINDGGGSSNRGPTVEGEDDIISSLQGGGALFDSSGEGGSGGGIVVDGNKARDTFGESASVAELLKLWKESGERKKRGGKLTTGEYYALVAATLASDDASVERAEFGRDRFSVTYRSRGALFWVIPWSFPVSVTVIPKAVVGEERVAVRFPWYHWVLREYFTRAELVAEIDGVVGTTLATIDPADNDAPAEIALAVVEFLSKRVRSVSDSVLLLGTR